AAERIRVMPGQLLYLQESFAAADLRIISDQPRCIAHHQTSQLLIRALGWNAMSGHSTTAQHRGLMTQRPNLAELVADKQNAAALDGQSTQGDEQLVRLLRSQDRGRLIENQQANVLHQATND